MMEAVHIVISAVSQTPSIGFDPWKNVVPTGVRVNSPTTSFIAKPSISVRDFSKDFVDILVCIQTNDQTVALFAPLLQLRNQVFLEFCPVACEILLLGDKIPAVLLIGCATLGVLVVTWAVPTDDLRPATFPLEGHHGPLTEACLVLARLIVLNIFCQGPNSHKACPSFLYLSKIFVDIVHHHGLNGHLLSFE
jgi:hypothetical protein